MPMTGKQVHAIMLSSTFVYGEQAVMVKYCPKEQPVEKKERKLKRKSDRSKRKNRKEKKPKEPAPEPESEEKPEDPDYDGYYDDILPPDLDRQREGLDKKLIQRVAVITGVVAVIIGLCVAALYLL